MARLDPRALGSDPDDDPGAKAYGWMASRVRAALRLTEEQGALT